jgi:hypothetical protein
MSYPDSFCRLLRSVQPVLVLTRTQTALLVEHLLLAPLLVVRVALAAVGGQTHHPPQSAVLGALPQFPTQFAGLWQSTVEQAVPLQLPALLRNIAAPVVVVLEAMVAAFR